MFSLRNKKTYLESIYDGYIISVGLRRIILNHTSLCVFSMGSLVC